jgi:glycosyltransferase involved in cell wall biosynthesis
VKPRIAIVIPCYNHGRYIQEAVDSVLSAKRQDIEMLILDDGSTEDLTKREMERLAREGFRVIRQENRGLGAARNAAIAATTADYVLPLDADNRIRPAYIEHTIRILDANPRVGVVYGDAQKFGSRADRWVVGPFDQTRLMRANFIDACAGFRRVLWEQHGGYETAKALHGLEDWDFWLGSMTRGWEFVYVDEILFDYRVMEGSLATKSPSFYAATEELIGKKYGHLYRDAWMEMQRDLFSVKKTGGYFSGLVTRRIMNRFLPAHRRRPTSWLEATRPAR